MFVPKRYLMDHEEAVQLMKSHPFALLVTVHDARPIATHIPVQIHDVGGKVFATGHIAYGNMQRKTFDDTSEALLIFQGPHAYISSSWYEVESVPTWDYLAVHAYGNLRILTKDELAADLAGLLKHYEGGREHGRLWHTFDPQLLEREMKGIVGFQLEITSIEASAKMSQNRNDADYKRIVTELEKSGDEGELEVARWMRLRREELFD